MTFVCATAVLIVVTWPCSPYSSEASAESTLSNLLNCPKMSGYDKDTLSERHQCTESEGKPRKQMFFLEMPN